MAFMMQKYSNDKIDCLRLDRRRSPFWYTDTFQSRQISCTGKMAASIHRAAPLYNGGAHVFYGRSHTGNTRSREIQNGCFQVVPKQSSHRNTCASWAILQNDVLSICVNKLIDWNTNVTYIKRTANRNRCAMHRQRNSTSTDQGQLVPN